MAVASRRGAAALLQRAVGASSKRFRPLSPATEAMVAAVAGEELSRPAGGFQVRSKTTSGSGYSPLNDPSPNWSNRPPKETILLDGCDYEHWLIVMEFPEDPKPSEDEMVAAYVRTLTAVLGR